LEFIKVVINRAGSLEVSRGLKAIDGSRVEMGRTEFILEFSAELLPTRELGLPLVHRVLLPSKDSGNPLLCSTSLHVRHSPDDLKLLVPEVLWTEADVGLT
jgi:hypothetical protein